MSQRSDSQPLRIDKRGRVLLLTFNRPDALNAFNDALYDAVCEALRDAAEDPQIAVVVLTGAGRAFTAGQDLGELGKPTRHPKGERHGFGPFIETLEAFPKPLVAAVNGVAVGIGLTLLPHCDLVLIADGARLRAPFVSLGVTAEAGSTHLLPAAIGWQQTAHLLYTAAWLDARRAVEVGLAWRVLPADELLDEALSVADRMAKMPIASLVGPKRLLLDARLAAVRDARGRENATFGKLVRGPANREAIAAFRERREPNF
ncbi:MAG: enoyl-CoA hydratase-related protein, partial [Myxococcota bacterium]